MSCICHHNRRSLDTFARDLMYRSAGLFELLGIRAEDALPTNEWWTERMHPDDLERTQAEFLRVPAGVDRFESEYRVRHATGHWVYPSFVTLRTVKSFAIIISVIQKAIANDFTVSFNFQP